MRYLILLLPLFLLGGCYPYGYYGYGYGYPYGYPPGYGAGYQQPYYPSGPPPDLSGAAAELWWPTKLQWRPRRQLTCELWHAGSIQALPTAAEESSALLSSKSLVRCGEDQRWTDLYPSTWLSRAFAPVQRR